MTRTGLSSPIQSCRHSGNSVLCPRSAPSTKRLIRSSRKSRKNLIARIKLNGAFLHSLGQKRKYSGRANVVRSCTAIGDIRVSVTQPYHHHHSYSEDLENTC